MKAAKVINAGPTAGKRREEEKEREETNSAETTAMKTKSACSARERRSQEEMVDIKSVGREKIKTLAGKEKEPKRTLTSF